MGEKGFEGFEPLRESIGSDDKEREGLDFSAKLGELKGPLPELMLKELSQEELTLFGRMVMNRYDVGLKALAYIEGEDVSAVVEQMKKLSQKENPLKEREEIAKKLAEKLENA